MRNSQISPIKTIFISNLTFYSTIICHYHKITSKLYHFKFFIAKTTQMAEFFSKIKSAFLHYFDHKIAYYIFQSDFFSQNSVIYNFQYIC